VSSTALVPIERQIGKVRRHAVRNKYRKRTMNISLRARATAGGPRAHAGVSPWLAPVAEASRNLPRQVAGIDWAQAQRIASP